jgi:hypothetical protein
MICFYISNFLVYLLYRCNRCDILEVSSPDPLLMSLVPLNALVKRHSGATEDIQSTTNSQVDFALAIIVHLLQILEMARTAGIGNGDGAPLGQPRHQFLINTLLKAFYVGSVNQEFGTVGFQKGDGFYQLSINPQ